MSTNKFFRQAQKQWIQTTILDPFRLSIVSLFVFLVPSLDRPPVRSNIMRLFRRHDEMWNMRRDLYIDIFLIFLAHCVFNVQKPKRKTRALTNRCRIVFGADYYYEPYQITVSAWNNMKYHRECLCAHQIDTENSYILRMKFPATSCTKSLPSYFAIYCGPPSHFNFLSFDFIIYRAKKSTYLTLDEIASNITSIVCQIRNVYMCDVAARVGDVWAGAQAGALA